MHKDTVWEYENVYCPPRYPFYSNISFMEPYIFYFLELDCIKVALSKWQTVICLPFFVICALPFLNPSWNTVWHSLYYTTI